MTGTDDSTRAAEAALPTPQGARPTVFIVDDDAPVRRGLSRLLRSAGYAVEEFASAAEFLEREAPSGTGCLILDVRMPQMTGVELFEQLLRRGSSVPVIFLTGHGDVPTSVHTIKQGAVDFLLKPVDDEALLRAIREAVDRHVAARAREDEQAAIRERLGVLSPRELQVMGQVVRGRPNKLIAVDLGISEKTVKVHRHRVMEKTRARSVAELVRLADAGAATVRLREGSTPNDPRQ